MSNYETAEKVNGGYRMNPPSNMPSEVVHLMQKCWENSPEARPDFNEICEALKEQNGGFVLLCNSFILKGRGFACVSFYYQNAISQWRVLHYCITPSSKIDSALPLRLEVLWTEICTLLTFRKLFVVRSRSYF